MPYQTILIPFHFLSSSFFRWLLNSLRNSFYLNFGDHPSATDDHRGQLGRSWWSRRPSSCSNRRRLNDWIHLKKKKIDLLQPKSPELLKPVQNSDFQTTNLQFQTSKMVEGVWKGWRRWKRNWEQRWRRKKNRRQILRQLYIGGHGGERRIGDRFWGGSMSEAVVE